MPLALAGSLTAVQFRYHAELPLNLNKIEHFSKVSVLQNGSCPGKIRVAYIRRFQVCLSDSFIYLVTMNTDTFGCVNPQLNLGSFDFNQRNNNIIANINPLPQLPC